MSGRASRRSGGHASTRGTSDDHVPVLVARDRSGGSTDGSSAMATAATEMGIEHHALNMTTGPRVHGPWHIQNVNAYHSRLKGWIRRFRGVATKLPAPLPRLVPRR